MGFFLSYPHLLIHIVSLDSFMYNIHHISIVKYIVRNTSYVISETFRMISIKKGNDKFRSLHLLTLFYSIIYLSVHNIELQSFSVATSKMNYDRPRGERELKHVFRSRAHPSELVLPHALFSRENFPYPIWIFSLLVSGHTSRFPHNHFLYVFLPEQ